MSLTNPPSTASGSALRTHQSLKRGVAATFDGMFCVLSPSFIHPLLDSFSAVCLFSFTPSLLRPPKLHNGKPPSPPCNSAALATGARQPQWSYRGSPPGLWWSKSPVYFSQSATSTAPKAPTLSPPGIFLPPRCCFTFGHDDIESTVVQRTQRATLSAAEFPVSSAVKCLCVCGQGQLVVATAPTARNSSSSNSTLASISISVDKMALLTRLLPCLPRPLPLLL